MNLTGQRQLNLDEFWVIVHRYNTPSDKWGVHRFMLLPDGDGLTVPVVFPMADRANKEYMSGPRYTYEGAQLLSTSELAALRRDLEGRFPGLVEVPVPGAIRDYVFFQVAPIEWHQKLARGDQSAIDWLSVLAPMTEVPA